MDIITELENVIRDRQANPKEGSYTCRLFDLGVQEICKKVGEEAIEVIVAAINQGDERLAQESADLIYHLLVLLAQCGVPWSDVQAVLAERRK
jgi:phosphoribosyl-ATP pyrophosphohydrolase